MEAKKPSEDLDSASHQEQLLDYTFREGVNIAILTNGIQWWFYLPAGQGSWEQREFFAVDLLNQSAETVSEHLETFLGRESVLSGRAVAAANEMLDEAKRRGAIHRALPQAWKRLVSEPDELLADLLAEAVESQCGYRPDAMSVAEFLARVSMLEPAPDRPLPRPAVPTRQPGSPPSPPTEPALGFTGLVPTAFTLFGIDYPVATWKGVLLGVASVLYERHHDTFALVLDLRGRKRTYFSTESDSLTEPAVIGHSAYFAETNLSANNIMRRCGDLLRTFGYDASMLRVTTR